MAEMSRRNVEDGSGELWVDDDLVLKFDNPRVFDPEQMHLILTMWYNFPWIFPIDARGRWE